MTEYVLATYDEAAERGRADAVRMAAGDVVHLHLTGAESAALGVFEGESELGVLPRQLWSESDFGAIASPITSKLSELGQVGADIRVSGDFNVVMVALGDGADRVTLSPYAKDGIADLSGRGGDDTLLGSGGVDGLQGGDGRDRLSGRGGEDLLTGGSGGDRIDGGAGVDRAMFGMATHRMVVDLEASGVNARGEGRDSLVNVEDVWGTNQADNRIAGDAAPNNLLGGSFHDVLFGRGGDDVLNGTGLVSRLYGGDGNDVLYANGYHDAMTGGAGADRFVIINLFPYVDHITDFQAGDIIDLSQTNSPTFGGPGAFHLVDHITQAGDAVLEAHARHGFTELLLNTDDDVAPDARVRIEGLPTVADFVL